jgi:hypothetical protein
MKTGYVIIICSAVIYEAMIRIGGEDYTYLLLRSLMGAFMFKGTAV